MKRRAMKRPQSLQTTTPPQPPAPRRELTAGEAAEVQALQERLAKCPKPPSFTLGSDKAVTLRDDVADRLLHARLAATLGVTDPYALTLLINQVGDATPGSNAEQQCNTALAILTGIQPRDEVEGLLAVQMVGCHNLAMTMVRRARTTDRLDCLATYGNLAAKLLRKFTLQTEALARLRGQTTRQTVRVEHVHVESGGQAVVGAIATRHGADDTKN